MDQKQDNSLSPADSSPQSPAAAFSWSRLLVNLVLLPALVVAGLVALVVGLQWLTAPTRDVPRLVDQIAQRGKQRLSAAALLAVRLTEPEAAHLRRDPELAEQLGRLLRRELHTPHAQGQDLRICVLLCRSLGQLEIAAPLPALVEAVEAGLSRDGPCEPGLGPLLGKQSRHETTMAGVACVALESIAQLAARLEPQKRLAADRLPEVLLAASRDPLPEIRLRAAFALGVVGGEGGRARLEAMLGDPAPDVRFNAAIGLSRLGNAAGTSVLGEMLRFEASSTPEQQTLVRLNAMRALVRLSDSGVTGADDKLKPLLPAIRQLAATGSAPEVCSQARALLKRLDAEL